MGQIFFLKGYTGDMGQILNKGPRVLVSVLGVSPDAPGPEYALLPPVPPRDHPQKGV